MFFVYDEMCEVLLCDVVYKSPHAWNSLPQFVTDCTSSGTFRKYLKTYLHVFSLTF